MRFRLAAAIVLGLSGVAAAQSSAPRSTPAPPRPTIGLPLPTIGLPLPQIGLPLPSLGLPSSQMNRQPPVFPSQAPVPPRGRDGRGRGRAGRAAGTFVYLGPSFGWPYAGTPSPSPAREGQSRRIGTLRLELQQAIAPQVFVDGYYLGMLADIAGTLALDAGTHQVELRADGYDVLIFNVDVPADRVIIYRGTMNPVAPPTPPLPPAAVTAVPAPPPTTIYMVAGCYAGNVPPSQVTLPPGCDAASAIVFEPSAR